MQIRDLKNQIKQQEKINKQHKMRITRLENQISR